MKINHLLDTRHTHKKIPSTKQAMYNNQSKYHLRNKMLTTAFLFLVKLFLKTDFHSLKYRVPPPPKKKQNPQIFE